MSRKPSSSAAHAVGAFARLCVLMAFCCGALFAGYLFYGQLLEWLGLPPAPAIEVGLPPFTLPDLQAPPRSDPLTPPDTSEGAPTPVGAVSAGTQGQPPAPSRWNGKERVNFLLMGVDLRPGERVGGLTDSMIIVSLDPDTKSVAMLSLPRDLWVTIPDHGENRINTAYAIGQRAKTPGGGPVLAKRTVQANFGIPIHYYVMINFVGFRKLVDALGGLTIDVPKDIYDPTFPNDTYGVKPLFIAKGRQHMNGQQALDYARTRHVDSDFGRMKRQQQVLMAIKDQALRADIITKIPSLWALKEDAAQTDLRLEDILTLARMAQDVRAENITSAVIADADTEDWVTPSGAMVLLPDHAKINKLVQQLFKSTPTNTASAQPGDQFKRLASENARIAIANGTRVDGLGGQVAEWLKAQGFTVVLVDTADRGDYAQTAITQSGDKPFTLSLLMNLMRVPSNHARRVATPSGNVDIRIILGQDFDASILPNSQ
ncbi:MAG: LCP family protein [Chloroflexota bacterium]